MFSRRRLPLPSVCTILAILLLFNTYDIHCKDDISPAIDETSPAFTTETASPIDSSTAIVESSLPSDDNSPSSTSLSTTYIPDVTGDTGASSTTPDALISTDTSSTTPDATSDTGTSSTAPDATSDTGASSTAPDATISSDTSPATLDATTSTDASSTAPDATSDTDTSPAPLDVSSSSGASPATDVTADGFGTSTNSPYSEGVTSSNTNIPSTDTSSTTNTPAATLPPCYPDKFPFHRICIDPGTNSGVVLTSFILSIVTFVGTLGVTSYVLFFRKFFSPKKSRMLTAHSTARRN